MDELLKITDLSFKRNETILKKVNLFIGYDRWYTLLGKTGSGKTTLVKIIVGLLKDYSGDIEFNYMSLNSDNIREIREKISAIFTCIDDNIVENNVYDEITFELKNMNYNRDFIDEYIDDVDRYTGIKELIGKNVSDLSLEEKYMLVLTTALIKKPKLLILDECFTNISSSFKRKIYKIIKKYNEDNKMTVINITNDIEDSLLGNNIILLENKKIAFNETTKKVFNDGLLEEKPFILKLSESLKLYELIEDNYFTWEELVDALWK